MVNVPKFRTPKCLTKWLLRNNLIRVYTFCHSTKHFKRQPRKKQNSSEKAWNKLFEILGDLPNTCKQLWTYIIEKFFIATENKVLILLFLVLQKCCFSFFGQYSMDFITRNYTYSLCAVWMAKDSNLSHANSENSDQTVRMQRRYESSLSNHVIL